MYNKGARHLCTSASNVNVKPAHELILLDKQMTTEEIVNNHVSAYGIFHEGPGFTNYEYQNNFTK